MRIIPVLDLKGGVVVRAAGGRRDEYRPIVTPLSATPEPVAVATGLRTLHPFSTFYIADLDAIEGRDPNRAALARLRAMKDPPELWVDAGLADEATLEAALAASGICPVLGSESQNDDLLLRRFCRHPNLILSLDFFAEGFHGPQTILEDPTLWPGRVIVMTLAKVGAGGGPDFDRMREVKVRAGDRTIIAAGGVRDAADLHQLKSLGVGAALVATALHDKTLTAERLVSFSG
ncbi:HisA/HisF-related TIM barrel protein [Mesorhizobium sp. LHD-90]|uniref:HisA/HisF-related TIM barrel protein n=1 Tax=Mesorhizobium sp. LHD-90 TaxID=3071414 RepID=UPI0027DEE72C|nr:HisA/HisF-related TIM barrel protein [Mesorhizobium sp. LHD-90]MDQ6438249.1 HisA/HisF-related TIM barrel protein [Mesorhizobium sp. LHD-90]